MNYSLNNIKTKIDNIYGQIVDIRRYIHMHPELSEHEVNTSKLICQTLEHENISYIPNVGGNGVVGTISGKNKSKAIALRADIDALPITEKIDIPYKSQNPGVMHACGHDIHTAILLGSGIILNSMKDELSGSVKLLFQPAEETIGGAEQMIRDGCMENPDVISVLGLHVEPSHPSGSVEFIPGTMNAATCDLRIKVIGKGCHGAHPDKGIDALIPACNIVTSLQSIISRRLAPTDSAVITIGKFNSGTKENIISGEVNMSGTIRTLNLEHREFIKSEVKRLSENICTSYGATCEVELSNGYPSLENNDEVLHLVQSVSEEILGKEKVYCTPKPSLGADDFAYFCHKCPSLYFNLGTCKSGDTNPAPIHNEMFNPDEHAIKTGILIQVMSVLKLFESLADFSA